MECMCHWRYNSWMFYRNGNGNFHTVIGIWEEKWFWVFELFSKLFLFEPSLFEQSLKSKLVKVCAKEYEGKIMGTGARTTAKNGGKIKVLVFGLLKNRYRHFYLWPPGKIVPKVFITSKQREISSSPWAGFYRIFVHKCTSTNIFEFITQGIY